MEVANIEVARDKKERRFSKTDILHQNLPDLPRLHSIAALAGIE